MGSSKKTETTNQNTSQNSTNTYGYVPAQVTPQMEDYRAQIDKTYAGGNPSIGYDYNNQRKNMMSRFDNPFGANYSPEVADAYKYNGQNELDQAQGQAYRQDSYNNQQGKLGALGGYADATAPKLVQTGGSSTGSMSGTSQSVTPFNWGGLLQSTIGAGAQLGSAVLT